KNCLAWLSVRLLLVLVFIVAYCQRKRIRGQATARRKRSSARSCGKTKRRRELSGRYERETGERKDQCDSVSERLPVPKLANEKAKKRQDLSSPTARIVRRIGLRGNRG